MKRKLTRLPSQLRQQGFSIIELLVAMTVAVFLMAGLFTVLQGTRDTSSEQTALAQLQDNERLAMSILTDMIQSAGYFPIVKSDGTSNNLTDALLVDGASFASAGQSIYGGANGAGGDMITVRFQTSVNDGVQSCLGHSPTAGEQVYKNLLQIDTTANALTCSDNNGVTAVPLITGIQNMAILWGVNSSSTNTNSNCPADTYFTSAQMTTNLQWTNVCTVDVTLTFTNPLATTPNGRPVPGQNPTVLFRKVITIMTKAGAT